MARPSDPTARIKLLVAAEAAFVEGGLDGTKVLDITRRAGLSKGAFYLHFESKEQAFRELVEAMIAKITAFLEAGCAAGDSVERRAFLDRWVSVDVELFEFIWHNRGLIRLLLEGGSGASFRYLVDEFTDRATAKTRTLLEDGVRLGMYRSDIDLDLTAELMCGVYDRLARTVVKQSKKPALRPMLEQIQRLLMSGIGSAELNAEIAEVRPPQSSTFHTEAASGTVSNRRGQR